MDGGDDLSEKGAEFRRRWSWSWRNLEFGPGWRGIWLGVEERHWRRARAACGCLQERERRSARIDMFLLL